MAKCKICGEIIRITEPECRNRCEEVNNSLDNMPLKALTYIDEHIQNLLIEKRRRNIESMDNDELTEADRQTWARGIKE